MKMNSVSNPNEFEVTIEEMNIHTMDCASQLPSSHAPHSPHATTRASPAGSSTGNTSINGMNGMNTVHGMHAINGMNGMHRMPLETVPECDSEVEDGLDARDDARDDEASSLHAARGEPLASEDLQSNLESILMADMPLDDKLELLIASAEAASSLSTAISTAAMSESVSTSMSASMSMPTSMSASTSVSMSMSASSSSLPSSPVASNEDAPSTAEHHFLNGRKATETMELDAAIRSFKACIQIMEDKLFAAFVFTKPISSMPSILQQAAQQEGIAHHHDDSFDDPTMLCEAYQYLGLAHFNSGAVKLAYQAFRRSLRLRLQYGVGTDTIHLLLNSALKVIHKRDASSDVQALREALQNSVTHEQQAELHCYNAYCEHDDEAHQPASDAAAQFQLALQAIKGDDTDEANLRYKLGHVYAILNDNATSLFEFRSALRISNKSNALHCKHGMYVTAQQMGHCDDDIETYLDALPMALAQETMGDECVFQADQDSMDAIQHYRYAIDLEQIGIGKNDQIGVAVLYTKMGAIHELHQQYQEAMSCHCHSLAIYEPCLGSSHQCTHATKEKIKSLMLTLRARR